MENIITKIRHASLRRQFVFFALILFSLIFISGSIIFIISMSKIVQTNTGHELVQSVQIERIKLEASVNGEIAIAMKMAASPLIIQHFIDPQSSDLRRLAFAEIEAYRQAFKSNTVFWASDTDKEFYFSENDHYTVDADNPDNYWYKMTLYETEKYNFNINYNPEIKKIMLWINAPVFNAQRTPIGLVGTGIDLTDFVDAIYRSYRNKGDLYFFNTAGEITGALDASLITNKVTISKALDETGAEIFSRAQNLQSDEIINFRAPEGIVAFGKIQALDWYIASIQPIGIGDILSSGMTALFLAMMAVLAVIFVIFYVFINGMLKPLNSMMQTLDHISVDWDLTQRLHLHRHDEIGTLGEFFNMTFEKIRELLLSIRGKTVALSDTGDELSSYMIKTGKDLDGINANIQLMSGQVLNQTDKVNSTAGSMERIIGSLAKLNDHITIQANSVAQSSSAIEEMFANIQSVTQTLVKNTQNIQSLAETSEAGRADLLKVATDIQEIAKESEGLLQINSVMQTIASQTNLLAMNAAIEAAHAGDSGKGFAVVADEIRKLAENSGKQSKTISGVLKKIKAMIDAITKSTSIVLDRFKDIEREVQTVSDQENQIRNAMEEQGEGSRQILDAVNQLNNVTGMVRKESSDITTESRDVANQSSALKAISAEVAVSMDEMFQNTNEIANAITRVQEISEENKENIDTLRTDITRFKVE